MEKRRWTNEEVAEYRKTHENAFYANPQDTRIMVPKAFGFGFTFNWANPLAWVAIVGIIALAVLVKYLFMK
jgi:uncharacterized membrane protein